MDKNLLYDISDVCRMLDTTSRTLRFYEKKGIIKSTIIPFSTRRKYTKEQIDNIKNVLVLRKLGLSVKAISELQQKNTDLRNALLLKRAEIWSLIDTKEGEVNLINQAIVFIDENENIFAQDFNTVFRGKDITREAIIRECNHSIITGDSEVLYKFLSEKMKAFMPPNVFESVRKDTLLPLGKFVSVEKLEYDKKYENIIYQYIKYEKLGLKVKYIFHGDIIHGLWLEYYKP